MGVCMGWLLTRLPVNFMAAGLRSAGAGASSLTAASCRGTKVLFLQALKERVKTYQKALRALKYAA